MHLSDFDFSLPDALIAQQPAERRDGSRMLVVDRSASTFSDRVFTDISEFLAPDDVLVLNNTKVFPARLFGRTPTGAGIEIFLIEEMPDRSWRALARPGRRLRPGKVIEFGARLTAVVADKEPDGKVVIRFDTDRDLFETLDEIGKTPLPPYIRRDAAAIDEDRERYQTVFAAKRGAIAAPTAGLHFTSEVLQSLREKGVTIVEITLHVGYGTFEPVRVDDLSQHRVAAERYHIGQEAADTLNSAMTRGQRVVAIGTTTTRTLEDSMSRNGRIASGSAEAMLTITPGYDFKAVGALLTNFHLPQSSLLVLTSTFGGHELIMSAYRHAVDQRYRFYSYGDCMLIV